MIEEPASDEDILKISINTILRDIHVDPSEISQDAKKLAKEYGYRSYMVQRYIDMLGLDEAKLLLHTFDNFRYRPALLCNLLKISCEKLVEELSELQFVLEPVEWCRYCYTVESTPKSPTIGSTHQYLKGFYYIYRDLAPVIPPIILNPIEGSSVIDVCAAPGGKAIHLSLLMRDRGLLVLNDVDRKRLSALLSNYYRMGFKSYIVTNYDAVKIPEKLHNRFDYVLVDAPCSAEGAIMFDKSRKRKTSQKDLAKLVLREIEILAASINLAKRGGMIVYTTCSIAPEENEYVITKVMEFTDNRVEIVEPHLNKWSRGFRYFRKLEFHRDVEKCIRIWPQRHGMEGFFICLLRKLN